MRFEGIILRLENTDQLISLFFDQKDQKIKLIAKMTDRLNDNRNNGYLPKYHGYLPKHEPFHMI